MSVPEAPAETEAQQILHALEEHGRRIDRQTDAINALGENVQWAIDNVKGIFEMFSNPAFMSMVPQMMRPPAEALNAGDNGTPDPGDTGEPGA